MYQKKPKEIFFDNTRMENVFLSMTWRPETYKKGSGFNYTKIFKVYIAKKQKTKKSLIHITED